MGAAASGLTVRETSMDVREGLAVLPSAVWLDIESIAIVIG